MGIAVNKDFGKISKGMTFKVKVLLVPIYNGFRLFPHPILVSTSRPKISEYP